MVPCVANVSVDCYVRCFVKPPFGWLLLRDDVLLFGWLLPFDLDVWFVGSWRCCHVAMFGWLLPSDAVIVWFVALRWWFDVWLIVTVRYRLIVTTSTMTIGSDDDVDVSTNAWLIAMFLYILWFCCRTFFHLFLQVCFLSFSCKDQNYLHCLQCIVTLFSVHDSNSLTFYRRNYLHRLRCTVISSKSSTRWCSNFLFTYSRILFIPNALFLALLIGVRDSMPGQRQWDSSEWSLL
jgi:hypothetical protein